MHRFTLLVVLVLATSACATPYFYSPYAIPGILEAEQYDRGGAGVSYSDTDGDNVGGAYRPGDGVDIESSSEHRYNVGWIAPGEWIEYTITSFDEAAYRVGVRVAAQDSGATFKLIFTRPGGAALTETPDYLVPATGGWQNWTTVTRTAELPDGDIIMRFQNTGDVAFNLNYFQFTPFDPADLTLNGVLNAVDALQLMNCLSGDRVFSSVNLGSCSDTFFNRAQLDADADVDLADVRTMQLAQSGVVFTEPLDYQLVWSDEFSTPGAPSGARWQYETGYRIRNNEAQMYTAGLNSSVENGNLIIESRKEVYDVGGGTFAQYTSASMRPRTSWTYGRFEVRAKVPTGRGMWPAIWMLGDRISQVGWPACGEIDIMENVGYDPDVVIATVHTPAYYHVINTQRSNKISNARPQDDFHIYSIEWTPEKIDFFFDRIKYFTFAKEANNNDVWPFDHPHHLKINTAVGGAWGGAQGIDDSIFPQRFYIDYVRVYQE